MRDASPAATRPPARRVVWLIGAVFALQPLSTDLYLPTLPAIGADFHVSVASVQATLWSFMAAFACAQLLAGPLSDRYGRLPVIVAGAAVHCVASLLCMSAPDMGVLLVGRVLQAIGSCAGIIAARAIARDLYGPLEGARLLAAAGAVMGIVVVAGPILGAQLQLALGWRAAFGFLAGCSALLLVVCLGWLAETNPHRIPGALAPRALCSAYGTVWRSASFRAFTLLSATTYGGLFAFLSSSSFVLIRLRGLSVGAFGYCFALAVSGYLVGTLVSRRLLRSRSLVATLRLGAALQVAGGLLLVALAAAGVEQVAALIAPVFLYLVAHGFLQPLAQAGAIGGFPRNAGAAAALSGFLMQIAAAAVGVLMGWAWNATAWPMTLAISAAALAGAAVAWLMLRDHAHVA